jgi:DNA-directed RNA polymerase subunit RPC12/RpoP
MVDPSTFFESSKVPCARCGKVNDLGSSERLYHADGSTRCLHCGFLFIRHTLRQMAKMKELLQNDPDFAALIRAGRVAEVKRRLDNLVPVEGEEF